MRRFLRERGAGAGASVTACGDSSERGEPGLVQALQHAAIPQREGNWSWCKRYSYGDSSERGEPGLVQALLDTAIPQKEGSRGWCKPYNMRRFPLPLGEGQGEGFLNLIVLNSGET
ncbi:MAG: hypothetical protein BM485_08030 [Desulfobulbaceae bacterium DB1]|nr:MAG: hypothetical protein BM485_08030 [Desulfobulbaceae bacterium DB1]